MMFTCSRSLELFSSSHYGFERAHLTLLENLLDQDLALVIEQVPAE